MRQDQVGACLRRLCGWAHPAASIKHLFTRISWSPLSELGDHLVRCALNQLIVAWLKASSPGQRLQAKLCNRIWGAWRQRVLCVCSPKPWHTSQFGSWCAIVSDSTQVSVEVGIDILVSAIGFFVVLNRYKLRFARFSKERHRWTCAARWSLVDIQVPAIAAESVHHSLSSNWVSPIAMIASFTPVLLPRAVISQYFNIPQIKLLFESHFLRDF